MQKQTSKSLLANNKALHYRFGSLRGIQCWQIPAEATMYMDKYKRQDKPLASTVKFYSSRKVTYYISGATQANLSPAVL